MPPNLPTHRTQPQEIGSVMADRVCRAWHSTSQVQVLTPGVRKAEGWRKGKSGWEKCRQLWKNCQRILNTRLYFIRLAFLVLLLKRS